MIIEKLQNSRVKATFEVTAAEFESALDQAFVKVNAKVTIKGFRAGKAPRAVYEKNYGVESLYDEALNVIFNNKAQEVYSDKELASTIVGQFEPGIEEEPKFERGSDFKVTLSFDVYPEVSLPQYKGIEVKAKNLVADEAEIEQAIKQLVKKDSSMVAKEEQVIALGDYATFDFCGSVDGVEFPGGKAENYELQIGSGQFIPGFEEQMVGMESEETKDVIVTFPESYHEASLAGKEAKFVVTVHEVKVEKTPELTDEYVQGLNIEGVTTLEELKANKKAELESKKVQSEKDRQIDSIINTILDNAVVDMPKALIDERVEQIRGQYLQQAQMYNIPFETFLGLMNITKEQFDEHTYTQGSRQALFNVVVGKIIEVEKLAPTQEAIEAQAELEAAQTGQTKEQVLRQNYAKYYSDLAYKAFLDLILAEAKEI